MENTTETATEKSIGIIIGAGVAAVIAVGAGVKWTMNKIKARRDKKTEEAVLQAAEEVLSPSPEASAAATPAPGSEANVEVRKTSAHEERVKRFKEFIRSKMKKSESEPAPASA